MQSSRNQIKEQSAPISSDDDGISTSFLLRSLPSGGVVVTNNLETLEQRVLLSTSLYQVNAGADQEISSGLIWSADTSAAPSVYSNAGDANSRTYTRTKPIDLTDPSIPVGASEALFRSERYDRASGDPMEWSFPVTNGAHEVNLYFAETGKSITGVGQRVFDVSVEGVLVLDDYDIYAQAGSLKGFVETIPVDVTDGTLNIEFNHVIDNPKIGAIQIVSLDGGSGNAAPTVAAISNVSLNAGTSQAIPVSATDPDTGDTLTLTLGGTTPSWITLVDAGDGTGSLTIAPDIADVGTYSVTVTATDNGTPTASDSEVFSVTVASASGNDAPVVATLADLSMSAGGNQTIAISASDPNPGDSLTLSLGAGAPAWVSLSDAGDGTGTLTLSPGAADLGAFTVTVIAADDASPSASDSESFVVTVSAATGSGTTLYAVNAGGVVETSSGDNYESDEAAAPSIYSNASAAKSRTYTRTKPIDLTDPSVPAGSNEGLFRSERYDKPGGDPMLWSFPVGNGTFDVNLYFAEISKVITGVGQRVFDVAIEGVIVLDDYDVYARVGALTGIVENFTVSVNDGELNIEFFHVLDNPKISAIQIVNPNGGGNAAPVVTAIGDVALDAGTSQSVPVAASDTDPGDVLTLSLGGSTPSWVTLTDAGNGTGSLTLAPGLGDVGSFPVTVIATDDGSPNASDSEVFLVTVADVGGNVAPVIVAIDNVSVTAGDSQNVGVVASDSDVGDSLTLTLGAATPAWVSLVDAGDGTGTLTIAPGAADTGSFTVTVVATDDGLPNQSDSETFVVTVVESTNAGDVIYRIAAGSSNVAAATGPEWARDRNPSSPFSNFGAALSDDAGPGSSVNIDLTDPSVPAGTPEKIFQKHRFDDSDGAPMEWDFPVSAGTYEVRLYFAETSFNEANQRIFDVSIEGVTVLDDLDLFVEVGANKGVVKTFTVLSDGNLDIDFAAEVDSPMIAGIEIIDGSAPNTLGVLTDSLDFGFVNEGDANTVALRVSNLGEAGDPDITLFSTTIDNPDFTDNFVDVFFFDIATCETYTIDLTLNGNNTGLQEGSVTLLHSGLGGSITVDLAGQVLPGGNVGFGKSQAVGGVSGATTLAWGPDGLLYVGRRNGTIEVFDVTRNGPNNYVSTMIYEIDLVKLIPNHNDIGEPQPNVNDRLLTGIAVAGTATDPVIYTTSSDPRTGGGETFVETGINTQSGVLSKLTLSGTTWSKVDLVRGLPRSDEFHSVNGLTITPDGNTAYVAVGGNTNMGAPSNNFGFLPEYALSAGILSVDLAAIEALPTQSDPVDGHDFKYNIPTLDDEDRDFDGNGSDTNLSLGIQDVFGANDGKNQAIIVPGGPVQVHASGFRNPYDVLLTDDGRLYATDNGPNGGWGAPPIFSDNGTPGDPSDDYATNQISEPGQTLQDNLHFIPAEGFYAGHPNPTRASTNNTFNDSNPQSPVSVDDPQQGVYLEPGIDDGALATFDFSTNGLTQYTTGNFGGALDGDLLAARYDNSIVRVKLNAAGDAAILVETLISNIGGLPLDVVAAKASDPYPGTIWVADLVSNKIWVFEPNDFDGGNLGDPNDPAGDADNDGYTNADEGANATNPLSSADRPSDADNDLVSNLLDTDDDNDGTLDTADPFAIDALNGQGVLPGRRLEFDNGVEQGLLNMGWTGLMSNGTDDYLSLFDPTLVTAGAAAAVFTVDQFTSGTARGSSNTQENAFQIGFDPTVRATPFTVTTRIIAPYSGTTPQSGQEIGFFLGTGDQDNYMQLAIAGDNGGELQLTTEIGGAFTLDASDALSLTGLEIIDLFLTVDPATESVQASYRTQVSGVTGARTDLGSPASIAGTGWLNDSLAMGIIGTSPVPVNSPSDELSGTWTFIGVEDEAPGQLGANVASLNFPATPSGQPVTLPITLKNLGFEDDAATTLTGASLMESVFGAAGAYSDITAQISGVTLAAGESLTVDVTFDPAFVGAHDVVLSVAHTGSASPLTIDLSGVGVTPTAGATITFAPVSGGIGSASTSTAGAVTLTNDATSGQTLDSITIDLSTGVLQDLVFDPTGEGGDTAAGDLVIQSGATETGYLSHEYGDFNGGGFNTVTVYFNNFNPGESLVFSVDVDPSSIRGSEVPGPNTSGAVSGLELSGATVSASFSDGAELRAAVAPVAGSVSAGEAVLSNVATLTEPVVDVPIFGGSGVTTNQPTQSVRIFGEVGTTVELFQFESGLFRDGLIGGGFRVDSFETNSLIAVTSYTATIGAGGFVDIMVTLTNTDDDGGFNHLIAVTTNGTGQQSVSNAYNVQLI